MILRSAKIDPAQLGSGAGILYTVPPGFRASIKQLTFTNTTATARTITVYLVPSGGSPSATNTIVSAMTIPPTGQGHVSLAHLFANQVLNPGDTVQALASAATAISAMGGVIEELV